MLAQLLERVLFVTKLFDRFLETCFTLQQEKYVENYTVILMLMLIPI